MFNENLKTMKFLNFSLILLLAVSLFFTTTKLNKIQNSVYYITEDLNSISNNISLITEIQIKETKLIGEIFKRIETDIEDNIELFSVERKRNVVATMYHPVREQTDDTPNITADGTKFDINRASDYRYIAVSRDLHSRYGGNFDFNDVVYIKSDDVSGLFIVKDLMNSRFNNRIDILLTPNEKAWTINDVELFATNIKIVD